jgi:4-hydroxybenzoyl-CoA thioesterase
MTDGDAVVLASEVYRVRMADVDAAGVLYYASPYRWLEGLFTGWLAEAGHPVSGLLAVGFGLPCVTSSAHYSKPLRLDDHVTLRLLVDRVGKTSVTVRMEGRVTTGELAVEATMTNVCSEVDESGHMTKTPVPGWLRALLVPAP